MAGVSGCNPRNPDKYLSFAGTLIAKTSAVTFYQDGGHFVKNDDDGNGKFELATASDQDIVGWAETGDDLTLTADTDYDNVKIYTTGQFWMPADAAVTAALKGKTCDIVISAGKQYADVGSSSVDVLKIVEVDITNQLVLVELYTQNIALNGVA